MKQAEQSAARQQLPQPAPADGLPPLPRERVDAPRQSSYVVSAYYDGLGAFSSSAGSFIAGNSLVIPASPDSLGYAVYAFNTNGFNPSKLEVALRVSSNDRCWVAIGDYGLKAWRFYGPYSSSTVINLGANRFLSDGGQFFAAVVPTPGAEVSCDYLVLSYENALQAPFSISGTVTDEHGDPVGGVRVLSDPEFVEVSSDAAGKYYLPLSSAGTFFLSPSSTAGYNLSPLSPTVEVDGHESGVNFSASRVDVRGRIVTSSGDSLSGVTLTLQPGGLLAMSGADGVFEFQAVAAGASTVEAQLAGYTFEPLGFNIVVGSSDFELDDFIATGGAPTFAVRGRVINALNGNGAAGITLLLNPGNRQAVTAADGNYAFFGIGNGSYSIEPRFSLNTFSPESRTVVVSDASSVGNDFFSTPPPVTYQLSGDLIDGNYALPIAGAVVRIARQQSGKLLDVAEMVTGADGRFSFNVPNGTYYILPEKSYYKFQSPAWKIENDDYDYIVAGTLYNDVTWQSFIEGYVYNNCIQCHRPDASVPATPYLRTYQEVITSGTLCNTTVQADAMPPQGGNPELFQRYWTEWTNNNYPLK
ncbi:hypothetical protein IT575_12830 [bacterium]|nr:hypothetical protein [bacterium]